MRVDNNTKMLLLRYNNYRQTDFIQEHKKVLDEHKKVWILKAGKYIPAEKMQGIIDAGGYIVFKAPKKVGGQYFLVHAVEYFNGEPYEDMEYPYYYEDLVEDEVLWAIESLDGTWMLADAIEVIDEETVNHFYLISNGKKVSDVVSSTMSSTMYITCDKGFETHTL